MAKRYATREDFNNKREFCYVIIDVNDEQLTVTPKKGLLINDHPRNTDLRFACWGCIEWMPLGEVKQLSWSAAMTCQAIVIDYVENYDVAVLKASRYAEKIRNDFVAELAEQARKIQMLTVTVNTA